MPPHHLISSAKLKHTKLVTNADLAKVEQGANENKQKKNYKHDFSFFIGKVNLVMIDHKIS